MMHVVVIHNKYLQTSVAVVGPFDTKADAQHWLEEKDRHLTSDETMSRQVIIEPRLMFGGR